MAWNTDLPLMVRYMINDCDTTPVYSDLRLQQTLVVAAKLVLFDAQFSQEFTPDLNKFTISPDPTMGDSKDDSFATLFTIRAAALIELGEAKSAAKRGYSFKDDNQSFDGKGLGDAYAKIMQNGWLKIYEDSLEDYQMNSVAVIGSAILSPFRVSAYGVGMVPRYGPFVG